jgi:transcriptional regulator with XRE-family HTH domain
MSAGKFAQVLDARMAELNLSVRDVASASGINKSTVHNLRRGVHQPSPESIMRLSIALDIDLRVLTIAVMDDFEAKYETEAT